MHSVLFSSFVVQCHSFSILWRHMCGRICTSQETVIFRGSRCLGPRVEIITGRGVVTSSVKSSMQERCAKVLKTVSCTRSITEHIANDGGVVQGELRAGSTPVAQIFSHICIQYTCVMPLCLYVYVVYHPLLRPHLLPRLTLPLSVHLLKVAHGEVKGRVCLYLG